MLANVQAGFDSYVEFAPGDWKPPLVGRDRERTLGLLGDAETFALLGLAGGRPAGHVAFLPARESEAGDGSDWTSRLKVPGLTHLWQLFVLPKFWGTGLAPILHQRAVAEMRARQYEQARLYTPSLHARARRFYERRGWEPLAERWNDGLQLVLTEYRLDLRP